MTIEEINAQLDGVNDLLQQASKRPPMQASTDSIPTWWSVHDAMTISSIVLLFGLLVVLLAAYLIRTGSSMEGVLRIFGTILILVMAVFLVVAGYSDTQIAPVMGLLGTIAGYLLGKDSPVPSNTAAPGSAPTPSIDS